MRRKVMILAVLGAIAPAMAGAQQWYNTDGGITERSWLSTSTIPNDLIVFTWFPTLPTSSTLQFVAADCTRSKDDGEGVGRNKVTFQGLQMLGGDSQSEAAFSSRTGRMKKGVLKNGWLVWDITSSVQRVFSTDSFVVGGAEAVVKGRVNGLDELVCRIEIVELRDPDSLASAGTEERLQYFHQVQRRRGEALGPLPTPKNRNRVLTGTAR